MSKFYCECSILEREGDNFKVYRLAFKDDMKTINEEVYLEDTKNVGDKCDKFIRDTLCESYECSREDILIGKYVAYEDGIFGIAKYSDTEGDIVIAPVTIKGEDKGYISIQMRPWEW